MGNAILEIAKHADEKLGWDGEELAEASWLEVPSGILGGKMLTRGTVATLAGQPGVGKTWLALALADAAVNASTFAGIPTEQSRVLFISEEMTAPEMRERIVQFKSGAARGLRFRFQQEINLQHWKGMARLRSVVEEEGKPDLVIIDAFRDVHSGPENNNDTMAYILKGLRNQIARPMDCCILLIHHYGKPTEFNQGAHSIRGASVIYAMSANVFLADIDKDGKRSLSFAKTRRCKPPMTCEFDFWERADGLLEVNFSRDGDAL